MHTIAPTEKILASTKTKCKYPPAYVSQHTDADTWKIIPWLMAARTAKQDGEINQNLQAQPTFYRTH
jgi:hypothetical protein